MMVDVTFAVNGMVCEGCVASVQRALKLHDGVGSARASLEEANVQIAYDPSAVDLDTLTGAIQEAGFDIVS